MSWFDLMIDGRDNWFSPTEGLQRNEECKNETTIILQYNPRRKSIPNIELNTRNIHLTCPMISITFFCISYFAWFMYLSYKPINVAEVPIMSFVWKLIIFNKTIRRKLPCPWHYEPGNASSIDLTNPFNYCIFPSTFLFIWVR